MMRGTRSALAVLTLVAAYVVLAVGIWAAFLYAPEERVMGPVQKIFYFHVPAAMVTFVSVFVLLVASLAYLWTRKRFWDNLARASTEIGIVFCTLVLITGPIWAKPAWGVWWTWEARLTTTLILWLLLAACLMVRGYADSPDQGARLGAVLGIVAALDVPIIYKAVDWWRGQHPVVFRAGGESALAPAMGTAFAICAVGFLLLYALLLSLRMQLAAVEDRTRALGEALGGR